MGIKDFTIEYDGEIQFTGQMITGRVLLSIDQWTEMKGVTFTLSCQVKCAWKKSKIVEWGDVKYKETFFEKKLNLADGGSQNYTLPMGDYVYPFCVSLPTGLPSTFKGKYGGITYSGKATLHLPWGPNKIAEKCLLVENLIDLNRMIELKRPYENEQSKNLSCLCCRSAPLTLTMYVPHRGFVCNEAIPITIDVENSSDVVVKHVYIYLKRVVNWSAANDSKEERVCIKSHRLGRVDAKASKTWTKEIQLGPGWYPNSVHCGVVTIGYELVVELRPGGLHRCLKIGTPITIGDVSFEGSVADPSVTSVGFCGSQLEMPTSGFGYNPDHGVFTANPPNVRGPLTNFGIPYPEVGR